MISQRPAQPTSTTHPSVYAKYVGRVGALAVALGVTGAMATTPGIAWAAPDQSGTQSSNSTDGAGSAGGGTTGTNGGSTTGTATDNTVNTVTPGATTTTTTTTTTGTTGTTTTGTGTGTGATTGTTAGGTTTQSGSQTESDLGGGVIIRSSGGSTPQTGDDDETDTSTEDETDTGTGTGTDESPGGSTGVETPPATDTGATLPGGANPPGGTGGTPGTIAPKPPAGTTTSGGSTGTAGSTGNANTLASHAPTTASKTAQRSASPSTQSTGATSAAQLLSAAAVANQTAAPAAANPVTALIAALPTPNEVFQQVKSFVTACACTIINQTLKLVNGLSKTISNLMASGGGGGTGDPAQTPILWTMVAWVRRQVEGAVTAFNRTPIGEWVHGVTTQIATRIQDTISGITNSPLGYTISSRLTQFLQECNGTVDLPDDLDRLALVGGLNEPTDFDFITHVGDDGQEHIHAIVIIEKSGGIKIYDPEDGTLSTLASLSTTNANGERGLVGVEVDPDFNDATKEGYHKIYVAYTNADNYDQLSQLTVNDTLTAVTEEKKLLQSDQLGNDFHHGGELEFDPTGTYLYWAVGNNVVNDNSHDLTTIHGKILRMYRDGSAPEDNPFYNDPDTDVIKQIYAIGFRNPFRFGFTPDGHLLSGDVGEAKWEELNVVVAGGDYGWPQQEGPCSSSGCGDTLPPLWAYQHTLPPANVGSITSVLYYNGTALPEEYRNKVFVADYSVGWIKMLTFDDTFESLIDEKTLDTSAGAVVQMKQGVDGNIYQLTIYPGTLSIITASGGNKAPTAVIDPSATYTDNDSLTVDFDGSGSSDPDGANLTYQWNFGNGQTSTAQKPTVTFTNTGADYTAYTVTLTVSDGEKTNTATQRIVVGSVPPTITLGTIADHYNAGDTITFAATASDSEDGALSGGAFDWKVVFHHNTHTHPFVDSIVGTGGSVTIPTTADQLSTTWYRIELTVTDSSGLKTTTYKDVYPNLVDFTVTANNPNATFTIDGVPHTGSFTEKGVVGVQRVLSAPSSQHTAGGELVFLGWSDSGNQTHTVTTPVSNAEYGVTFGLAPALV